jgi:hypothetical protein
MTDLLHIFVLELIVCAITTFIRIYRLQSVENGCSGMGLLFIWLLVSLAYVLLLNIQGCFNICFIRYFTLYFTEMTIASLQRVIPFAALIRYIAILSHN